MTNEQLGALVRGMIEEWAAKNLKALVGGKVPANGARKGKRRNVPRVCTVPGCGKASKGPRYSFTCETHKAAPKAKRSAWLAAWKKRELQG